MYTTISLRGYTLPESHFTFNLAAGIVAADVGKAVAFDGVNPNQVRLAGDGDPIFGRLEAVENREQAGILVGTVARQFSAILPMKTGETVAVGSAVQGAGLGEVKALAAAAGVHSSHDTSIIVMEVLANDELVVQKI